MGLPFSVLVREDPCGEGGFTRPLSREKMGSLRTAPLHRVCRGHWKWCSVMGLVVPASISRISPGHFT